MTAQTAEVINLRVARRDRAPKAPAFPEIAQSPELAITMAIYAALTKAQRRKATRSLIGLASRNAGSDVAAPNAAYDLINRMNAVLEGVL